MLALAALAAASGLAAMLRSEPVVEGTDAFWYDILGWNLAGGRGFSLLANAPFEPTMYREPGYAAIVAAVYALAGHVPRAVTGLQALLLGGIVILVALLGRRAFGERAALVAALLTAISPDQVDVGRQLLSETVFTALLLGVALLVLGARERARLSSFLLVGLLWGVLTLVRVQGQLLLVLLLPLWLLLDRVHLKRWRVGPLLLVAGAASVVVLPWMARNTLEFGRASLSQRYGAAMLPRGVRTTYGFEQHRAWAGQALWMATNPYSAAFIPLDRFQYGRLYFENDIWDFHLVLSTKAVAWGAEVCDDALTRGPAVVEAAVERLPFDTRSPVGLTNWRAKYEDCGLAIGLRLIREHPLAYLAEMPLEWVKLNFYPLPSRLAFFRNTLVWLAYGTAVWLIASSFIPRRSPFRWRREGQGVGGTRNRDASRLPRSLGHVAVSSGKHLALRRRMRPDAVWLVALVGAYNAQAIVADPAERYAVPLLPLYYLFAAVPLAAALAWVHRLVTTCFRRPAGEA